MLEPDIVNAIRRLKALGHGTRNIGKLLELDRKTVRRWLDGPVERKQVREGARRLKGPDEALARELFEGVAEGNAVVVGPAYGRAHAEKVVLAAMADYRRQFPPRNP